MPPEKRRKNSALQRGRDLQRRRLERQWLAEKKAAKEAEATAQQLLDTGVPGTARAFFAKARAHQEKALALKKKLSSPSKR
jgi:hypothetical protein